MKMSESDTAHIGGELVLDTPSRKHVGTLFQTSHSAPDGIVDQSASGSPLVPWDRYITDGQFRVESGETSGQYVYEQAQVLKEKLNALAADDRYFRETHGLRYWSGE
jgi:hypothetical protein